MRTWWTHFKTFVNVFNVEDGPLVHPSLCRKRECDDNKCLHQKKSLPVDAGQKYNINKTTSRSLLVGARMAPVYLLAGNNNCINSETSLLPQP